MQLHWIFCFISFWTLLIRIYFQVSREAVTRVLSTFFSYRHVHVSRKNH